MSVHVWCLGNILLGDDAVGCRIAELLKERGVSNVVDCGTTPENYLATLQRGTCGELLIIDAADMELAGGEIRLLSLELFESFGVSNHGIPLSLLLQPYQEKMNICIIGIQPLTLALGASLSPQVEYAALEVAAKVEQGHWKNLSRYSPSASAERPGV